MHNNCGKGNISVIVEGDTVVFLENTGRSTKETMTVRIQQDSGNRTNVRITFIYHLLATTDRRYNGEKTGLLTVEQGRAWTGHPCTAGNAHKT